MKIQNSICAKSQLPLLVDVASKVLALKSLSTLSLATVLGALSLAVPFAAHAGLPPVVTNVVAVQQALPSKLVTINYTLSDPDSLSASISILVSSNSGATWTVPATNFTGDYGPTVSDNATPTVKTVIWNAGTDFNGQFSTTCRVRVLANDDDYAYIPGGNFIMGDNFGDALGGSAETDNQNVQTIYVSSFYMDSNLVTGAAWTSVFNYAVTNGYSFDDPGASEGLAYPVQGVSWFDAVKWCNARSQMLNATPVYYTDATMTNVYQSGQVAPYVKTNANGYRLPTEAEWEKAARGGVNSQRFPFGNTINETQANYYGNTNNAYDSGPSGYNTNYIVASMPYTSPVGSFAPNGYGIYDMAGNVYEWCQDWYGYPYNYGTVNPQGPTSGAYRVLRAGAYNYDSSYARCAARGNVPPTYESSNLGFRCVRSY